MAGLDFGTLRNANLTRCERAFHPITAWSPTDWACAFAGEAGEACNLVKKLRRLDDADYEHATVQRREELIEAILDELADTVIYADLLATRLGRNLGEAVVRKFDEVSERRGSSVRLGETA